MRFSNDLISWYYKNKRDLPWRETSDPYVVWLSEIILQQTRVAQGLSYFNNFIKNYPTVIDLAKAKEDDVLKLWQGLGYYSRARNLHFTAKLIANNFDGKFPRNYNDILSLKGIGEYTAAAISSFSYNLPYPVIDGNVYRVLSRVFGIDEAIDTSQGKKTFKKLATKLIDKKRPADYNQAIMEFGAINCTPKKPKCENCIFRLDCFAFKNNTIEELPIKSKKIKQRVRNFNYLVFLDTKSNTFIKQRKNKDIWIGLYDFPVIESEKEIKDISGLYKLDSFLANIDLISKSTPIKHILSHQIINAVFWKISLKNNWLPNQELIKVSLEEINNYPVPKLVENYIKTIL